MKARNSKIYLFLQQKIKLFSSLFYQHTIFLRKKLIERLNRFSNKTNEKVTRESLTAETQILLYFQKIENDIKRIFTSVIMIPNFIHFHKKERGDFQRRVREFSVGI